MKPWDELTERGQFRRLRPLACAALQAYGLQDASLTFVGGFTNAIYRVDSASGTYALRVDYMQDHPDWSADIELAWLAAVAAETDLDVCRVVPTTRGALYTHATAPGVPGSRRCSLFEWIPGKPLHEDLRPERYHQLGVISAQLHLHGARFTPPRCPMPWDRIFYWPEDLDPIVYHLPENSHHFGAGRRDILERAIAVVEPAFGRLDPEEAQVIHGDIHPWNVHVKRKRMVVFDFEDVTWGHRVQDVAITFFYERSHPAYYDLREAFREGYSAVAPWPEAYPGEIEHFMAARTLMFVNFVLNLGRDLDAFFENAFPRLEQFLGTWT